MAYSDYGAFVYCNGERRKDKEDSPLFSVHKTDWTGLCHGCMGDGDIRVMCYKQGLPSIYEVSDGAYKLIEYADEETDYFEYDPIDYECKGYKFHFESGKPYTAQMIEPDGKKWECSYDYWYGAGFEFEG